MEADAIVTFLDKFVSEFSWKRLTILVALIFFAGSSAWLYDWYTGHFRAVRMQFAAEQLARLSDPQLKKNIEGDPSLQRSYVGLKDDLADYVTPARLNAGLPPTAMKPLAAFFPWAILAVLMLITDGPKSAFAGCLGLAIPFVFIAMLLPTFKEHWINYALYPLLPVAVLLAYALVVFQKKKFRAANS